MTEDGARAEGNHTTGNPDKRRAGRRRNRPAAADPVPNGGKIEAPTSSTVQVVMAIALLVIVIVVAFGAVSVVGDLFLANRTTYWMIELIFALLCGSAGALVGGSAVVRSTLRIPGSPVHATLGGAAAMVIVGFALAYLGEPQEEKPAYAVEVHDVPDHRKIGNEDYLVSVTAGNSDLTFSRGNEHVSLRIPPNVGTHQLRISVFKFEGKDMARIFARCELTFEKPTEERNERTLWDLVAAKTSPQFHLYFSKHYVERAVTAALKRNESVADEACLEGEVANKKEKALLGGRFTLQTNSVNSRVVSFTQFNPLQRYSIVVREPPNVEPQDTQPDLPPHARPVPAIAANVPVPPRPSSAPPSTQVAEARAAPSQTTVLSAPPRAEEPLPAPVPTAGPAPPAESKNASTSLNEQIDAYVRGEDRDRTQLYESWSKVADYVVQGLRRESAKGSVQVAPHLNLISNALNVIEGGRYLSPTLRPNWDQSAKSNRLTAKQGIPGFGSDDYRIVVESLCSEDEDVRRAAQRMLRLYPSNHFYKVLQALPKQTNFNRCRVGFIAETAAFYFYNRIVEYDGTFAWDQESQSGIDQNYADGVAWARRGEASDAALPVFTALLDYAHGLVLLDHGKRKAALDSFGNMTDAIRTSGRIYPSNPRHIATALMLTQDAGQSAKALQAALVLTPPDRRPVARNYVVSEGAVALFAAPDGKLTGKMKLDAVAHVYLRVGNSWDLLEGAGQIGWARRVLTSSAR
jgi:hypothetical protein